MKNKFLMAVLCIGLLTIYFACEKDDSVVKEEQVLDSPTSQIIPTIKTVAFDEAGETFNRLTNAYQLGGFLDSSIESNVFSRSTLDTLGITIYTDNIKEVTAGDYTSYTMLIATPNTTDSKFYNLTIEDKNGESGMFVTKYIPTENWLSNKDQVFEGSMSAQRVDNFTTVGIDDGGGTNDDDYPNTNPPGSLYYPTDCNGYIYVTIESIPYQCSCEGHWPWENCHCVETGGDNDPGYNDIPYYQCLEADEGNNPGGPDDSNNPSGPSIGNPSEGDGSISVLVPNEDVPCEPPYSEWDIYEPFCSLDELEICNRDYGSDSSICECVSIGGTLSDCIFEYEIEQLYGEMDKECQSNIIGAFLNISSEITNKITNAFFGNDNYNLQLLDVDLPIESEAIAFVEPPSGMVLNENTVINIRFDNSYLENTTNLSIALTAAHEFIHVNFYYLFIEGTLLSTHPDYTEMNIAFENFEINPTELNSENMEAEMHNVYNDFIEDMTNSIYLFAEANNIEGVTEEYCRKLVIGHHQDTNSFQNLTAEEQLEYSTIAENEQNGNTDAKGSKCEE